MDSLQKLSFLVQNNVNIVKEVRIMRKESRTKSQELRQKTTDKIVGDFEVLVINSI